MEFAKIVPQYCQLGNIHQDEELQFVCLEFQCRKKNLACRICQQQYHASHQTITLQNFVKEIQRKQFLATEHDLINEYSDANDIFAQCQQNIVKLQTFFNNKIKSIQTLLQKYSNEYKIQQLSTHSQKKGFGYLLIEMLQKQCDPKYLNQVIYGILCSVKIDGNKIYNFPKSLLINDKGEQELNQFINNYQTQLLFIHNQLQREFDKISNYFTQTTKTDFKADYEQFIKLQIENQEQNENDLHNNDLYKITNNQKNYKEFQQNINNNNQIINIQNQENVQDKQILQIDNSLQYYNEQNIDNSKNNNISKQIQIPSQMYFTMTQSSPTSKMISPQSTIQKFFIQKGFQNLSESKTMSTLKRITKYNEINLNNLSQNIENLSKSNMLYQKQTLNQTFNKQDQNQNQIQPSNTSRSSNKSFTVNLKQFETTNKKFRFSMILKHKFVILTNNQQTCESSSQSNSVRMVLAEPTVEQRPQREVQWSFKINKLKAIAVSSPLAIGLCHQNIASKNKYTFDGEDNQVNNNNNTSQSSQDRFMKKTDFYKRNEQHGCYLLSSNGIIRNHCDLKQDMKFSSLRFNEGDIIDCFYSPFRKTLTFKRQGTEQEQSLNILVGQKDMLFPCVRLSFSGDMVEIINH